MNKWLTRIQFKIYSKKNPKRFDHQIFKEGKLTRDECIKIQHEYVKGRNPFNILLYTDVTIIYYLEENSLVS